MEDYRVKGVGPDMTEAAFLAVLDAAKSPVRPGEARAIYSYCLARGASPAWLLAVFKHESSFGKAGTATQTHSWGNTRAPSFGVPDLGQVPGRSGSFSKYANWADGGVSTVARIYDHKPYANAVTVREITPIWAPPSDQNDTARYIAAVLADIARFAQLQEPTPVPQETSMDINREHPSPNRGYRNGHQHQPQAIVWHITQGTNSLPWLTNPASGASSNYLIARNGTIYELVPPTESAWANGAVCNPDSTNPLIASWSRTPGLNFNQRTISIEHEGKTSKGKGGSLTAEQVKATVGLTAMLCGEFGIPADQGHILGHYEIDSCQRPDCPGFSPAEWKDWVVLAAEVVQRVMPESPTTMMEPVVTERENWSGKGRLIRQTVVVTNDDTGMYYENVKEYEATGPVIKGWREV